MVRSGAAETSDDGMRGWIQRTVGWGICDFECADTSCTMQHKTMHGYGSQTSPSVKSFKIDRQGSRGLMCLPSGAHRRAIVSHHWLCNYEYLSHCSHCSILPLWRHPLPVLKKFTCKFGFEVPRVSVALLSQLCICGWIDDVSFIWSFSGELKPNLSCHYACRRQHWARAGSCAACGIQRSQSAAQATNAWMVNLICRAGRLQSPSAGRVPSVIN
mmetsp:Transcript_54200/g.89438  ORF Transcript_54200/g.89438 Transcript_54200/m.89438 type:complete len:215 (+) Transcript_54200:187-831(+)